MRMVRTLAIGAASLSLVFALSSCGSSQPAVEEVSEAEEQATVVEETADATDEHAEAETHVHESEDEAEIHSITQTTELQRIGSDEYGYVSVPADWVKFVDIDGNDSIQYSDPSGYSIVSLNVFDLTGIPEEELESFGAYEAANSVWYNIEDGGGQDVTGATVMLAGQTAYQVYAYYPDDDSYLVTWTLADEQGTIHYVAAEGPAETIMDVVTLVEGTYSFTE